MFQESSIIRRFEKDIKPFFVVYGGASNFDQIINSFRSHFQEREKVLYLALNMKEIMTYFKLTASSFYGLRNNGIPDTVLRNLESLENQEIILKKEFLDVIEAQIGKEQTNRYEKSILKHSETIKRSTLAETLFDIIQQLGEQLTCKNITKDF